MVILATWLGEWLKILRDRFDEAACSVGCVDIWATESQNTTSNKHWVVDQNSGHEWLCPCHCEDRCYGSGWQVWGLFFCQHCIYVWAGRPRVIGGCDKRTRRQRMRQLTVRVLRRWMLIWVVAFLDGNAIRVPNECQQNWSLLNWLSMQWFCRFWMHSSLNLALWSRTNVLVITTSNPPGGAGEQNPTIHNHWEKIMWTSKFFRHGICRSGGFQTESWKPWSESALRYCSVLSLWTNPHKHHHKPVSVSWTVLQPATLFSSLLDLIFPNRIIKDTDDPLDLSSFADLLLVPLKRPQDVGEAQTSVLLLSLCNETNAIHHSFDCHLTWFKS